MQLCFTGCQILKNLRTCSAFKARYCRASFHDGQSCAGLSEKFTPLLIPLTELQSLPKKCSHCFYSRCPCMLSLSPDLQFQRQTVVCRSTTIHVTIDQMNAAIAVIFGLINVILRVCQDVLEGCTSLVIRQSADSFN